MKKTAIITACAVLAAMFTACGEGSASTDYTTSETKRARVSNSPLNEDLIGTWMGEQTGYRFQDDRQVSLIMDFSSMLSVNEDGIWYMAGTPLEDDNISFDGTTLSITYHYASMNVDGTEGEGEDIEVVTMKRNGDSDANSYDGEYTIESGSYVELVHDMIPGSDNAELTADIEGENFTLTVVNYCYYETLGDSLEMFSDNMNYVDANATAVKYRFEINGDDLTLTYTDAESDAESVENLKRQD